MTSIIKEYVWFAAVILLCATASLSATNSHTASRNDTVECSAWFMPIPSANGSTVCKCGSPIGDLVQCDSDTQTLHVPVGYCMTYSDILSQVVVGSCAFPLTTAMPSTYRIPSLNITELNTYTCGHFHRERQLCGQCISGYAPGVFNQCVKCTAKGRGLLQVLLVQTIAGTVFFILIVALSINISSGSIYSFVFFSQMMALPSSAVGILEIGKDYSPGLYMYCKLLISFYSIWNLDFFLPFFLDSCLREGSGGMEVLALRYILPVYLLILTLVVYAGTELHARKCRLMVWLWAPFHRCLGRFRHKWNMKTSIINALATLFLLSYTKVTFVSLRILLGEQPYFMTGEYSNTIFVLVEPTVKYGGKEHLPFLIVALFFLVTVGVVPIAFLTFYQFRWFQKCLDVCRLNRQSVRAFVEVFQGSYKNGVVGRHDFRFFSGVYLIMRLAVIVIWGSVTYVLLGIMGISGSLLFALFRPYYKYRQNVVDSLFFAGFSISLFMASYFRVRQDTWEKVSTTTSAFIILSFLLWSFPGLYIIILALYRNCCRPTMIVAINRKKQSISTKKEDTDIAKEVVEETSDNLDLSFSFPDRVLCPSRYQSLGTK